MSDHAVIAIAAFGISFYAAFIYIHHKLAQKPEPKPYARLRLVRR